MGAPEGNNNAEGNDGGRPTKYTKEFIELAKDYLENYETEYEDTMPSIAGLAVISNISRDTLHTWAKEEGKVEFSYIYEKLLAKQEQTLCNNGLTGKFTSTITKLILTKHGYSDKIDTDLTTKGKPITGIERKILE